jgi:hypothetical protein
LSCNPTVPPVLSATISRPVDALEPPFPGTNFPRRQSTQPAARKLKTIGAT